jgi:putative membrane protein
MELKTILWYGVLLSITAAYLVALAGVRAAKEHDVSHHSRRMMVACMIVGIWLVAYVSKQVLFGRERFGGTETEYWRLYVPVFSAHMLLAAATIGLGAYNLYAGLTRLRQGTGVGAMVAGVSLHRRLGKLLIWTFSGTMATAYLVYLMLFVWYPA